MLLTALVLFGCTPVDRQAADLVFRGGNIYTVDASQSWAEAVAIFDGEITFVGSDQGVEAHIGPETVIVDLGGRMMLPSFQDIHIHPTYGGLIATRLNLYELESVEDYVAAIDNYATAHPDLPWIVGGGWSMAAFGPGEGASRRLIDSVVADRPVVLSSFDGHALWVNSRALDIAGITKATPDPDAGRIDRDPQSGEAIGSLQDTAMYLVSDHMPPVTHEQSIGALKYAMSMLNRFGITAIQDATEKGVIPRDLDSYRALDNEGDLTLRVTATLWWNSDGDEKQIERYKALRE